MTKAREAEWQERQDHNDAEAARWEVEVPDGWGNTRPSSPVHEDWPGVRVEDSTWPLPMDVVPLRPDSWPDLSVRDGVSVTVEVRTTLEGLEGHSACRSLLIIGYLSVS
jgi:hypothetical protein